jgi:hypothetical protein
MQLDRFSSTVCTLRLSISSPTASVSVSLSVSLCLCLCAHTRRAHQTLVLCKMRNTRPPQEQRGKKEVLTRAWVMCERRTLFTKISQTNKKLFYSVLFFSFLFCSFLLEHTMKCSLHSLHCSSPK